MFAPTVIMSVALFPKTTFPSMLKFPAIVALPAIEVLPELASTVNLFVLTDKLPVIEALLESVAAPVTPNVPPTVVLPVTPNVLDRVVASVTPNVPAIAVLPELAVTLNLFVLTFKFPVNARVLESVAAPVTASVPPIAAFVFAIREPIAKFAHSNPLAVISIAGSGSIL